MPLPKGRLSIAALIPVDRECITSGPLMSRSVEQTRSKRSYAETLRNMAMLKPGRPLSARTSCMRHCMTPAESVESGVPHSVTLRAACPCAPAAESNPSGRLMSTMYHAVLFASIPSPRRGPPGLGKTATVQALARATKRRLSGPHPPCQGNLLAKLLAASQQ